MTIENRERLTTALEKSSQNLREKLISSCIEKSSNLWKIIEEYLIKFIEDREDELPMYLTYTKKREIERTIEDTPLIFDKFLTSEESSDEK